MNIIYNVLLLYTITYIKNENNNIFHIHRLLSYSFLCLLKKFGIFKHNLISNQFNTKQNSPQSGRLVDLRRAVGLIHQDLIKAYGINHYTRKLIVNHFKQLYILFVHIDFSYAYKYYTILLICIPIYLNIEFSSNRQVPIDKKNVFAAALVT